MTDLPNGCKVDVYWNLHKRCFSVRSRERDSYGRVIAHADEIRLTSATFIVSEAGRQRVLSEKRKNVHAFIRGKWSSAPVSAEAPCSYNPYKGATFTSNGMPVHFSSVVRGVVEDGQPNVTVSAPPWLLD